MHFSPPNGFYNTQNRKYVRFKASHTAGNLSKQLNNKNTHGSGLGIKPGDTGLIYRVNGATIFIGFDENLKTAPDRHTSPSGFAATISFSIHDIDKMETAS
ncbi:MAG: hypothetical protein ABI813_13405 [Bacteroidota bacterium]